MFGKSSTINTTAAFLQSAQCPFFLPLGTDGLQPIPKTNPYAPFLLRRLFPRQKRAGGAPRARMSIQSAVFPRARIVGSNATDNKRAHPPLWTAGFRPPVRVVKMRAMLNVVARTNRTLGTNVHKSEHVFPSVRVAHPRSTKRSGVANAQGNRTCRSFRTWVSKGTKVTRFVQFVAKTALRTSVQLLFRIETQPDA